MPRITDKLIMTDSQFIVDMLTGQHTINKHLTLTQNEKGINILIRNS